MPGATWQVNNGHDIRTTYGTNSSTEIRLWVVSGSRNGASYTYYPPGKLYATSITDENNNTITEYKDFQGKLICKKTQSGPGTFLYTDYIYDSTGDLYYVLPPLPTTPVAVNMPTSFSESDAVFLNFFYGYHYDGKHRLTEKKVPGKDWAFFVYNKLDQVILNQDPVQLTAGVWIFTKYDAKGRVVLTGDYYSNQTRTSLQADADSFGNFFWEVYNNSAVNFGYSHTTFPDITANANNKILAVNYYDNYDFISNSSVNPSPAIFAAPEIVTDTLLQSGPGLLTGSVTLVVGSSPAKYLLNVDHYDNDGRLVKAISQTYISGTANALQYDIVENRYSFYDALVETTRKHFLPVSTAPQLTIANKYIYDHAGRKKTLQQQYVSPAYTGSWVTLAKYDYNELGQLVTKHLHNATTNTATANFLQHIDYRYNPRGWLTRINNPGNLADENYPAQNDVFAEQLDYDQPNSSYTGTSAQYNGNISTQTWNTLAKSGGTLPQEIQGYVLNYDPLSRLTAAAFKSPSGNDRFNEAVTYDELGNVLSLTRNNTATTYTNNISYDYGSGTNRSNKLASVSDLGSEAYTASFNYDTEGNVFTNSKLQSSINYNELNLPSAITLPGNKTITFYYSASGEKLERVIKQGSNIIEDRSYVGGIEYSGNAIDFVHTPEGRARVGANGYIQEYNITDHLGNVRALIGDEDNNGLFNPYSDLVQTSNYYAFGKEITYLEANPLNQYKYNNKELLPDIKAYDYGARYYDPTLIRWNGVDNAAEKSRRWSPYTYALNNPIRNIDPDGNFSYDFSTAIANATASTLQKASTYQMDAAMQAQYFDGMDMDYSQGKTSGPAPRIPLSADMINGMPSREWMKFWIGNGSSASDGGGLWGALNGGAANEGMNWNGFGNFITHLTPFGGIVDFTNAAKNGDVAGAVVGLASTAIFFTGDGAINTTMVYRGDSKLPSEAFEAGFIAKGDNKSLVSHAFGADDSHFIPTSFSKGVATSFRPAGSFVYTIKQPINGIDLNTKFGFGYDFYHEYEWAVPSSIPGSSIHGAQQILPGGKLGEYIYNPFYK
jgi:RHS repeat-associated protein